MKKMKLAALGLTVFLAGSVFCMPVMADDADDAQANLDAVNASIAEYEQQKNDLLNQIDDLEAQLVTTISSVKHINEQLDEVSAKLSKTEEKLSAAEKDAEVQKNAMKAIDVDLAVPMLGTRVRKADDDLWMEVSLPNTSYDETAYLYKGTEYVGNENKAFNWLIVEHEVDPVFFCHPGR